MSYSNRFDLCDELGQVLDRLANATSAGAPDHAASVRSDGPVRVWQLRDRLSTEDFRPSLSSF